VAALAKSVQAQVVADAAAAEEGGDPAPAAALGPGEAGAVAGQEQLDGFKAYAMKAIWVSRGREGWGGGWRVVAGEEGWMGAGG
jgi:hypothetical protein